MTSTEFCPVLISRREIEVLELIADMISVRPGAVGEWATLTTLIDAAKRAHEEAEMHATKIDKIREETTNAPTGEG